MKHVNGFGTKVRILGIATAATLAPPLAPTAAAQQPEAGMRLEEVVVTARKVEENLMTVPLAISALTAEAIEARGIRQLADIAQRTPSFHFTTQGASGRNERAANSLVFRGLFISGNAGLSAGGQLFKDGAPVLGGQPPPITDVERVEVLKGPQSAYFGRSTFAGAINFVTRDPDQEFKARAVAEYSRFGSYEGIGSIEGGLTETLSARVGVRSFKQGGFYDNAADPGGDRLGQQTTNSVSATIAWRPSETLKVRGYLSGWVDNDGLPAQGALKRESFNGRPQANGTCPTFAQLPAGVASPGNPNGGRSLFGYVCGQLPEVDQLPANVLSADTNFALPQARNALFNNPRSWYVFDPGFKQEGGLRREAVHADLRVDWEFGEGYSLSSLTAHHRDQYQTLFDLNFRDGRDLPNPLFAASPTTRAPWLLQTLIAQNRTRDWSQEIRVASPADRRLRWTLGANYFEGYDAGFAGPGLIASGPAFTSSPIADRTVETPAAFGGLYYDLTDTVTVGVEGRFQRDTIRQQPRVVAPGVIATGAAATLLEEDFDSFSPRVTVDWKYAEDSLLYALFSRGYRPGGFNSALVTLPPAVAAALFQEVPNVQIAFDEEQLDMYEVGLKSSWLDGRARTVLTLYQGEWKDGQVSTNVLVPSIGLATGATINNGLVDLQGLEFEGQFQATSRLSVGASFAINESEVRSFGRGPGNVDGNCVDCNNVYGSFTGLIGRSLPQAPRTSGSVYAEYSAPVWGDKSWFARGDFVYQGKRAVDYSDVAYIGARKILGARVGLRGDNWTVEAIGNNLTDDRTMLSAFTAIDAFTFLVPPARNEIRFGAPIPRSFGLRVSYDF